MPSRTSRTRPSPRMLVATPSTVAGGGQRQPRQAGPIPSDEQPDPDQPTDRDPHQTVLGTVHRRPPRLGRRPRHSWTRPAPTRASIAGRPRRPLISTARCCRPRTTTSAESLTFPSPGHRPARSSATRACWNETASGSRTSTRPPPIDYVVGRPIGHVIEPIVGLWRRLRGRTHQRGVGGRPNEERRAVGREGRRQRRSQLLSGKRPNAARRPLSEEPEPAGIRDRNPTR